MFRIILVNSLWILGLAVIVADLSYFRYQSLVKGTGIRAQLGLPSFQAALYSGMVLIGLGLAGTSNEVWETVIWFALAMIALLGAIQAGRTSG